MKKLLTFVVMAMMAVSASAQLVAEKDWTGATGDLPWIQFESDAQGSAEFVEDGIAITVNKKTGELWQPQANILEGFDLAENGNYTVAIVAKFPCDGLLRINMGSWEYNQDYDIPVNASGDFQEVVCEFPELGAYAEYAHVVLRCGDFLGTIIVKSVQVSEGGLANGKWALVGDKSLLGVDWDYTYKYSHMYSKDGNIYTRSKSNLFLPKGTYEFKVFNVSDKQESYPKTNSKLVIEEDATYTVNFTFNENTKEVSTTAIKTDGLYFNFIPKGKVAELIQNPNGYKGTIIIPSTVTHEGVDYTVTKISESAFSNCSKLTSVTIPSSISSIANGTFSGCSSLTSVTIPNSVTSIGDWAFSGCSKLISITIPPSVTSIGSGTFYGCTGLTSINIPQSVTSIGESAFSGCTGLTSVTIPNSVSNIDYSTFYGCTGLNSIIIPNSVTSIGNSAFSGCTGLNSIIIPNNVTSIGGSAFKDCNNMSSVTIGEKVNNISSKAFANCQQLTDVFCLAENVPNTVSDVFNYSYIEYATLHVPVASLSSYSNSEPWKNFKNIEALEEGDIPATQKCATPTIKFENGVVKFFCATEGAVFVSTITPVGSNTKYDSQIVINNTYKVTVYATKAGYNNSDAATIEIQTNSVVKGDVNADGKVNVADHVELSKIILNQ